MSDLPEAPAQPVPAPAPQRGDLAGIAALLRSGALPPAPPPVPRPEPCRAAD